MQLVGTFTVKTAYTQHRTMETAAWYSVHEVQPGVYNLYRCSENGRGYLLCEVDAIVEERHTPTLFGGVQVGNFVDTSKGTREKLRCAYGFHSYSSSVPFEGLGVVEFLEVADLRIGPWSAIALPTLAEVVV